MLLTFDPAFHSGSWPGPLQGRAGCMDEAWVGAAGLLDVLETRLGLGGRPSDPARRLAVLVAAVGGEPGFWERSAARDPLGTARRLLQWRDALVMAGWQGQEAAPRLAHLARVTREVPPGPADRWAEVQRGLTGRTLPEVTVRLCARPDELPHRIRACLGALTVATMAMPPADAAGDLLRARGSAGDGADASGDGSLQLVQAAGVLQAAEDVAAWLAARPDGEGTLIVTPDPVLDAALRRHGLPTTGAAAVPRDNGLLQILPLVLALAWDPPDPQAALELLTMGAGPVPPGLARRLAGALLEWPAVGSSLWDQALRDGLDAIPDAADRARRAERLEVLLRPAARREDGMPAAELQRRLDMLQKWLGGWKSGDTHQLPPADNSRPEPVSRGVGGCPHFFQVTSLRALAAGHDPIPLPLLARFVIEATQTAPAPVPHPAQAGLAAVADPGAVAGPARRIVWWNFNREAAPRVPRPFLSGAERDALAALGVVLPEPGPTAAALAERWRRPLLQAQSTLLLVCPRRSAAGEEQYPHPLWDEVEARLPSWRRMARDVPAAETPPRRVQRTLQSLPRPRRSWRFAPALVRRRDAESPSSLGTLLGCSLNWALTYTAGLRTGMSGPLSGDSQLKGRLAHAVIADVLAARPASPEAAAREAERIFDKTGPQLAAALFLPGADAARGHTRFCIADAARRLVQHLQQSGLDVVAVETSRERSGSAFPLTGKPDLVVGPPRAIVDLKWSGEKYFREMLQQGTAYQLAAYAWLHQDGRALPPGAYFVLGTRRLLTTASEPFRDARPVAGPSSEATWRAFECAVAARAAEVEGGTLVAGAIPDAETAAASRSEIVDGRLVLTAPCGFCRLGVLCGVRAGGA